MAVGNLDAKGFERTPSTKTSTKNKRGVKKRSSRKKRRLSKKLVADEE